MLTMEDELIQVFVKVDDCLKEMLHQDHHHARLSDAEVITIGLMKEVWHLKTDKSSWRLINEKFKSFFPSVVWVQPFIETIQMVGHPHETVKSQTGSRKASHPKNSGFSACPTFSGSAVLSEHSRQELPEIPYSARLGLLCR